MITIERESGLHIIVSRTDLGGGKVFIEQTSENGRTVEDIIILDKKDIPALIKALEAYA